MFQSIPNKLPRNPKKSEVNLKHVNSLNNYHVKKLKPTNRKTKALKFHDDFFKTDDTGSSSNTVNDRIETTNTVTNLLMISAINSNHNISLWSANKSLWNETKIALMQVDFLPFIPHPITEYSTVYTALKNFVSHNVKIKNFSSLL